MRQRSKQRGFTLIELMVVVAVIAVLAAIAIPQFTKETRRSKGSSEVGAMMAELAVREDQYKLENGEYFDPGAACPATTVTKGQAAAGCITGTGVWVPLRVRLPQENLVCSYHVVTGTGVGTTNPGGFVFTSPAGEWFYVLATCDMDGKSTLNATYFVSSTSSKIQALNEGS
jgi:prepilin-type N-terminal cleavage/methylation domain-containing protein